ncbi:LysR family transcriptional regulator [Paraburkholderia hospita]|uniref:LysR family transcriptional regulator n=1 Tax=Paraburkholderia hospita TaxID=169430 RepID=UPI000271B663|nr:regulatory protein LysR [Burkholderia sp. BT03]SKC52038.1 regulatory helix-turn-helix protein, lysR family [Paraburkholderia hospita]
MGRLIEMRKFVAVVKFQSFTWAANRLGISTSSGSGANPDLETRSRAELFHCVDVHPELTHLSL